MSLSLLGRKVGMAQVNVDDGKRIAVTLLEVGPCLIMQKKTVEKDGYSALKIGYGAKKEKHTSKAMMGSFEKIKSTPRRHILEVRMGTEELGKYEEGKEITLEGLFEAGSTVDIIGKTKGRGFTGVFKRHGMKGNRRSHGTHEFFRHGGSIGCRTWPGRVHKNKRMPGHYGVERVTIENLKVIEVMADKNCILIQGAIPGAANALVEIRPSVRYPSKKAA